MPDFETVRAAQQDLVLAQLSLAVLFADSSTPGIETIEDPTTGDLGDLSAYTSGGIMEKDAGLSVTSDIQSTDIEGYGEVEPVRTIITRRLTKFTANFIETNKEVIEKYWGIKLDASNFDVSAHGGVTVKAPIRPKNIFYRCILLGQDEVNGEDLFPYWILPRVKLVEVENMSYKDDGAITWGMTFQAYRDAELGFSCLQGWCGAGWRLLVDKTGFVAAPTSINATPATATLAAAGTQQITVTASNGINRTPNCTYVSSTPAKATVSSTGLVTAIASGSSVITVTYDPPTGPPLTDTVAITVS